MKLLFIGHSHMNTLARAAKTREEALGDLSVAVLQLRSEEFRAVGRPGDPKPAPGQGPKRVSGVNQAAVRAFIERTGVVDAAVLCFNGNEHNLAGLFKGRADSGGRRGSKMLESVTRTLSEWLDFLQPLLRTQLLLVPSPPPIESDDTLLRLSRRLEPGMQFEPAEVRLALWEAQREAIAAEARRRGIDLLDLPASVRDVAGFLEPGCEGKDATHGNDLYGERVVEAILKRLAPHQPAPDPAATPAVAAGAVASSHPYRDLPDRAFWRQSVAGLAPESIDPAPRTPFLLRHEDKVATAGSCFAQHISRWLRAHGFNYLVAESREVTGSEDPEYGFSALYGNIYTPRQLLQLFQRAFGCFAPLERVWQRGDGRYCDAFRPRLLQEGFTTPGQVLEWERAHLDRVRAMFVELDVLVFTLGLTECWISRLDGAVYPLAPGVAAGVFDPARHVFRNLSAGEVTRDLTLFLAGLREVNPAARVVLTVSPVPLVATATADHVLLANTRSKAVLRVAAEEIADSHDNVCYFPSYELIVGAPGKLHYFEADCRSVTAAGVAHVMSVFMRHMTEEGAAAAGEYDAEREIEDLLDAECDEEVLARPA